MTKKEATQEFKMYILPRVKSKYGNDKCAIDEAWGIHTDDLCKAGEITQRQYETWMTPKFK